MSTPESKASLTVLLYANQQGCRLLKNNTGVAFNNRNRPVFFGLGNEGKKNSESERTPDWVGWHSVTITPEMVGKTLPVFMAIDAKKEGFKPKQSYNKNSREYGQNKFFQRVIRFNGIAGFASSAEQLQTVLSDFYQRMKR